MKKRVLGTALVLLLAAGSAWAGQQAGTFTVSPMFGGIVFEGDQQVKDDFAYGLGLGYNLTEAFALEAIFVGSSAERKSSDGGSKTTLSTYRLDALYHLLPNSTLVPYVAAGVGGYNIKGDSEFMGNYGLGLLYYVTDNLALRGDVRHLLVTEESNMEQNLLYTAGLKYQFGQKSAPPPVAAPAPAPAPAPVVPAPAPAPKDNDGDGVSDELDKCPDTPKGVAVDQRGCPLDSDGDGVADYQDQCSDTPKGVAVDRKGCPLDSDGDGVADYLDKCPETPKGVAVDAQGCELKLTLHINFDTNKSDIRPDFSAEVAKAAAFIKANSDIPYVLLSGHTDSQGAEAYNQKLSERRAEAVREELIRNHGIDGSKIRARGYGESQPVADNSTPEGRYENRRVEVLCCTILPE